MSARTEVCAPSVVVRLHPDPGSELVTAEELLDFARVAVANAGPRAAIRVFRHGLTAHRGLEVPS